MQLTHVPRERQGDVRDGLEHAQALTDGLHRGESLLGTPSWVKSCSPESLVTAL